ncbi:MAG: hypothetical protein ACREEM_27120 [Blastocatellia bacterium]
MSAKDKFTPEEWKTLLKAPMMVSYAVVGASPSGMIGFVKEMKAVADAILEAGGQAPADSLVGLIVAEIKDQATDSTEGQKEKLSVAETKGKALETCRQTAQILQAKAGAADAESYKSWLLTVGRKVAEAAKEGGFLGFGGERVSESETAVLGEIAATLGSKA